MKIKIPSARLSFPSLFQMASFGGESTGKFEATFILDKKDHAKQIEEIETAIAKLQKELKVKLASDKLCLKDGDEMERIMYGFSLFVCLPDGLSSPPSVGTGTVMRPSTLQGYGEAAGFSGFEVLPIKDFGFWRFYRLS